MKLCAAEHSRFEAPHESGNVKRRVYGRAVEQDQLQVGGRTPHVEHVGGVGGIVAGQRLDRVEQAWMSDPRCKIQRLNLEHRHRLRFAGRRIYVLSAQLPHHVEGVQLDGLGLQFEIDAYVGTGGNEHLYGKRYVPGVHHAETDLPSRKVIESIVPNAVRQNRSAGAHHERPDYRVRQ